MAPLPYSDIVFRCDDMLYVSGDMIQVSTGDEMRPAIFVRPDHRKIFLMSFNEIGVLQVEPLTCQELKTWLLRIHDQNSMELFVSASNRWKQARAFGGRSGTIKARTIQTQKCTKARG